MLCITYCFQYVPTKGDNVIGIITKTGSENFRVDIGSSMPAILGNLSFEGATKRNKPDLKVSKTFGLNMDLAALPFPVNYRC